MKFSSGFDRHLSFDSMNCWARDFIKTANKFYFHISVDRPPNIPGITWSALIFFIQNLNQMKMIGNDQKQGFFSHSASRQILWFFSSVIFFGIVAVILNVLNL